MLKPVVCKNWSHSLAHKTGSKQAGVVQTFPQFFMNMSVLWPQRSRAKQWERISQSMPLIESSVRFEDCQKGCPLETILMFVFIVVEMAFHHKKNWGNRVYALKSVIDLVLWVRVKKSLSNFNSLRRFFSYKNL